MNYQTIHETKQYLIIQAEKKIITLSYKRNNPGKNFFHLSSSIQDIYPPTKNLNSIFGKFPYYSKNLNSICSQSE